MKAINLIIISISLIFFSSINSTAQEQAEPDREIRGKIINKENNKPVAYAVVYLYDKKTNSMQAGALCNNKGEFVLKNVSLDNHYMEISHVSYKKTIVDNFSFQDSKLQDNENVIEICLQDIKIEEIIVSNEKIASEKTNPKIDILNY